MQSESRDDYSNMLESDYNGTDKRPYEDVEAGPSRKRRNIEPEKQRVEHSCDRCRKRKRKCMRPLEDASCVACDEAGVECQTTQPRKQRIYATMEQLSIRYRVLDSLIRSLYPEYEVESLKGLMALAEEKGVDIPREEGRISAMNPRDAQFQKDESVDEEQDDLEIPEGWLVPAPKGGYHYVGSASLVYFAQTVRKLVSKCNLATMPSFDDAGLRRYLRAAEFIKYQTSHTIEANIRGHPATVAAEEEKDAVSASPGGSNLDKIAFSPSASTRRTVEQMPERALADRLVQAFFSRVQPNFPLFHRAAFQVKYEACFQDHPDPSFFSRDPGWISILHVVFVLGAQILEDELGTQSHALQHNFLSILYRDGVERMVLNASLSNVQALLLLALYQHNAGERNSAWMLVGHACRTAVALGMHRDGENANFDPFERNTRRLVWWTLHMFEQIISLALGRPSSTEVLDVTTALPDATFMEHIGYERQYLKHLVSLCNLWSGVRKFVASTSTHYESPAKLDSVNGAAKSLLSKLSSWRLNLPSQLIPSVSALLSSRRQILLLHIWCDYLESIVTRAYILCRVNHNIEATSNDLDHLPPSVVSLSNACVQAAKASADRLVELADMGLLEGLVFLDFYAVQHAIMIIGLHFLIRPVPSAEDRQIKASAASLVSKVQKVRLAPTYKITMNVAMQLAYISGIAPDSEQQAQEDSQPVGPSDTYTFPVQALDPIPLQSDSLENSNFAALEQLFGPMPPSRHNSAPDIFADLYNLGVDTSAEIPWDFFNIGSLVESQNYLNQSSEFGQQL